MITEILFGVALFDGVTGLLFGGKDTYVTRGHDIFGNRYKKVRGKCFCCNGTGTVRGYTCRKCGGSGTFSRKTWYF